MKCKDCGKKLVRFYFDIGGREFCKGCALGFMSEINDFKVELMKGGRKA